MCIQQSHSIHISCDSLFSLFGLNIFSSFSQFSWIHFFCVVFHVKCDRLILFFALFLAFPVVYCEEVYCPYNPISAYPVGIFFSSWVFVMQRLNFYDYSIIFVLFFFAVNLFGNIFHPPNQSSQRLWFHSYLSFNSANIFVPTFFSFCHCYCCRLAFRENKLIGFI